MRTLLIFLIVFVSSLQVFPQGRITRPSNKRNSVNSSASSNVSYQAEDYEAIDIGLSVLWCNQNMGASTSDARGYRYGWSEITPRKAYSWKENKIPKYLNICGNSTYDVSSCKLKNGWRMPTVEEMNELKSKCRWVWNTSMKGYDAYGPNGKSIFLPVWENGAEYWTGTRTDNNVELANNLFFTNSTIIVSCAGIGNPMMIRPVKSISHE